MQSRDRLPEDHVQSPSNSGSFVWKRREGPETDFCGLRHPFFWGPTGRHLRVCQARADRFLSPPLLAEPPVPNLHIKNPIARKGCKEVTISPITAYTDSWWDHCFKTSPLSRRSPAEETTSISTPPWHARSDRHGRSNRLPHMLPQSHFPASTGDATEAGRLMNITVERGKS